MGEKLTASNAPAAGVNYAPGKNNDKILTTTLWNQYGAVYISIDGTQTVLSGVDYNAYCPYYYPAADDKLSTARAVTGCTNTADSQVIYYWLEKGHTFNFQITGDDWYEVKKGEELVKVSINDVADYKAGDMETINEILARGDYKTSEFIAALNYYCGVKNHSMYGDSTGTYVYATDDYQGAWNLLPYKALGFDSHYSVHPSTNTAFFTSTTSGTETKTHLTEVGYAIARECLDYGEVITVSIPGHSIYLDGYRYNESTGEYEYHLNYGWGLNAAQTKWYTEQEMIEQNIDMIGIDITPAISAHVSNVSGEYNAGTMLRAAERINHTQNDTSVTVTFADEMEGKTSSQQEAFAIISNVDTEFDALDFSISFSSMAGFLSYNALTFTETTGNLIINTAEKSSDNVLVGLIGDEKLTVSLSGAGVFAGGGLADNDIISALESFSTQGYTAVAGLADSASSYAFAALGGDDSITIADNSIVMGNMDLGSGSNTVTIKSGSTWYGDLESSANFHFVLDSQTSESFVVIAEDLNSFCSKASITVSMDKFTQGVYTLVDGSTVSSPAVLLSNLNVVVSSGGVTETLSVAGTAQGKTARVYLENGKLKLTQAGGTSMPDKYEGVMIFSSGALQIADTFLSSCKFSAGGLDSIYVGSNGTADTMLIGSGGVMHVLEEGFACRTEVTGKGLMQVSSGGSALETVIRSAGSAVILYGGETEAAEVMNGGTLELSSSGFASDTKLLTNGKMIVYGSAQENYLNGGALLLSSGGVAEINKISSGGTLTVYSKGSAFDTVVMEGGLLSISNGGQANKISLEAGMLQVNSGGVADSAAIEAGGKAYVERGGTLVSAQVESKGNLFVRNGGTARNIQINSWGSMAIANGGNGKDLVVANGGILTVETGGSANGVLLDKGDLLVQGGDAAKVNVSNGGRLYASSGAKVNGGEIYSSGYVVISSGAVASSLVVRDGGNMDIEANGTVRNTTVSSGGNIHIQTGADFVDLSVLSGGEVNGFIMNSANKLSGDSLQLSNCLVANEATLEKGQSANIVTVSGCGSLKVLDGASITSMTATAGAFINGFILNEDNFSQSGLQLNNVYTDGAAFLYKGQSAANAEIYADASLTVDGGKLLSGSAYAGATVNGFILQADNTWKEGLVISHGFVTGSAFLNAGLQATEVVVGNGGTLLITSGGEAEAVTIEDGGKLVMDSGVQVSRTTLKGTAALAMGNGALADTLTLVDGARAVVTSGGTVQKSNLWSYGNIILSSGAAAEKTVIENTGGLHIYSGATASETLVNQGGFLGIGDGAKAYETTIGYAGAVTVWSGGEVHNNTINTWGAIILSAGAIGNYTTIRANGGYHIYDGAIAYTTEVANGAFLGIGLGGTTFNLEVQKEAAAVFFDDSILRGWSNFAGTVTVNEDVDANGAMIAFDLTQRAVGEGNIISDASGIAGASYFVTLADDQSAGRYYLAGDAKSITSLVVTGTSTVLTAGGEAVALNENLAGSLNWDEYNNLYLELVETAPAALAPEAVSLGSWDEALTACSVSFANMEEEKSATDLLAAL